MHICKVHLQCPCIRICRRLKGAIKQRQLGLIIIPSRTQARGMYFWGSTGRINLGKGEQETTDVYVLVSNEERVVRWALRKGLRKRTTSRLHKMVLLLCKTSLGMARGILKNKKIQVYRPRLYATRRQSPLLRRLCTPDLFIDLGWPVQMYLEYV